jgi:hypothetical protein
VHFELEVSVAGYRHEFCVAGSPEYHMIGALKVYDFKGECLLAVVYLITECDRQSDCAMGHDPSSGVDPMKRGVLDA